MYLLTRLSWRNLWRNPKRSLLLISAIVVCIASLIVTLAWINGMLNQMVRNSIEFHIGELEVYKKGFIEDKDPANYIEETDSLLAHLESHRGIKNFAPRIEGRGLISSGYSSSGVQIVGIKPSLEADITLVKKSIISGIYLPENNDHRIIIGEKMAEKLKVSLGEKVVITVQTVNKELAADAFRISGIYKTISKDFDKYMVYIPIERARSLLEINRGVTGVAVRTEPGQDVNALRNEINKIFGDSKIEAQTWGELEPLIKEMSEISKQWMMVFFLAVFVILSIGIINTQNIAVYERMHELGVLKAIGTRPVFIFSMIMLETCFLGLTGLIAGFLISYPLVLYLSVHGLNLALFADGLQVWGLGTRIYLDLKFMDIVYSSIAVLITSFFGAFIPAMRAGRLEPVEAIKYI